MKNQFVEVQQGTEAFAKMQRFAHSFDHEIVTSPNIKVVAFVREGQVYGYADIVSLPIAFPAFHPELTKPRGVVEVAEGWRAHCQLTTGGQGYIGVPLEQDRRTFPPSMLVGVGFTPLKRELYFLT